MISWYRAAVKEHGAKAATRLLWRVVRSRAVAGAANRFLPPRVVCPCCGWEGRRFLNYVDVGYEVPNASCPRCDSHPRHRALYLWLKNEYRIEQGKGSALIFAPERALDPLWQTANGMKVCRVDIDAARGVHLLADIQRLPFAADSADLIWCHHVLPEVEDDRRAVRELRRVLRPLTGELVVSVYIARGTQTREFGAPDKTLSSTWRCYGDDFVERLSEGGLTVRAVERDLSDGEVELYGLDREDTFYICTKQRAASEDMQA